MTHRISFSALRVAVYAGLAAAALTGALASPAQARDDHDNWQRERHAWRQDDRRHAERYRQPEVYYYTPPVVYYHVPPVEYAPPVASFNFMFR